MAEKSQTVTLTTTQLGTIRHLIDKHRKHCIDNCDTSLPGAASSLAMTLVSLNELHELFQWKG